MNWLEPYLVNLYYKVFLYYIYIKRLVVFYIIKCQKDIMWGGWDVELWNPAQPWDNQLSHTLASSEGFLFISNKRKGPHDFSIFQYLPQWILYLSGKILLVCCIQYFLSTFQEVLKYKRWILRGTLDVRTASTYVIQNFLPWSSFSHLLKKMRI